MYNLLQLGCQISDDVMSDKLYHTLVMCKELKLSERVEIKVLDVQGERQLDRFENNWMGIHRPPGYNLYYSQCL